MMINDHTRRELGYDPSDQASFPYQADDPPFGPHRLVLEDVSLERAACLDVMEVIARFASRFDDDGVDEYRLLDMSLRLFVAMVNDPDHAFEGIAYPDIFAAALDQGMIWEYG